ncbi:hypothetical protein DFJ73DRAFT_861055 [Zopfochytrium polystomum]|nr:hypothetical protein DFJ73DRAFT_861055 [Zopfochytrium polystomum]
MPVGGRHRRFDLLSTVAVLAVVALGVWAFVYDYPPDFDDEEDESVLRDRDSNEAKERSSASERFRPANYSGPHSAADDVLSSSTDSTNRLTLPALVSSFQSAASDESASTILSVGSTVPQLQSAGGAKPTESEIPSGSQALSSPPVDSHCTDSATLTNPLSDIEDFEDELDDPDLLVQSLKAAEAAESAASDRLTQALKEAVGKDAVDAISFLTPSALLQPLLKDDCTATAGFTPSLPTIVEDASSPAPSTGSEIQLSLTSPCGTLVQGLKTPTPLPTPMLGLVPASPTPSNSTLSFSPAPQPRSAVGAAIQRLSSSASVASVGSAPPNATPAVRPKPLFWTPITPPPLPTPPSWKDSSEPAPNPAESTMDPIETTSNSIAKKKKKKKSKSGTSKSEDAPGGPSEPISLPHTPNSAGALCDQGATLVEKRRKADATCGSSSENDSDVGANVTKVDAVTPSSSSSSPNGQTPQETPTLSRRQKKNRAKKRKSLNSLKLFDSEEPAPKVVEDAVVSLLGGSPKVAIVNGSLLVSYFPKG